VKTRVDWTSPSGERFAFEYEAKRNPDASSVRDVSGTAYHHVGGRELATAEAAAPKDEGTDGTKPRKKRRKGEGEEAAGYLKGYEITRAPTGTGTFTVTRVRRNSNKMRYVTMCGHLLLGIIREFGGAILLEGTSLCSILLNVEASILC